MDSGMGGLSVLKGLLRYDLEIVYYGDLKNSPYGEKEASEILELVRDVCRRLQEENVNAILLACNTATSAAAQTLRKEFSIPIFGMEPAIKPAIRQNPGKKSRSWRLRSHKERKNYKSLKRNWERKNWCFPFPVPVWPDLWIGENLTKRKNISDLY